MKIMISDRDGNLREVDGYSVVLMLDNGQSLEITPDISPAHADDEVVIWGGRMPQEGMTLDTLRQQTSRLTLCPSAANCLIVRPGN